MLPQGNSILNTQYFSSLTDRVNNCGSCEELQIIVSEAFASINAGQSAVQAQIDALKPMLALASAPTDLGSVISWITNLINGFLNPLIKPYATYATQMSQLSTQMASLTAAIENAAGKFPSCAVNVPTVSMPTEST